MIGEVAKGLKFLRRTAHVVSIIAPLALVACVVLVAQSQPPAPGRGESKGRQPQQQTGGAKERPAADPRGTEQSPLVVKVQPAPKTDEETAKEKDKEDRESTANWWTFALAVSTGIVGLLQLVTIGVQAYIAHRQNKIMVTQSTIMLAQKRASDGMLATNKVIERAYVSMSHHPPGLDIDDFIITTAEHPIPSQSVRVNIRIQNNGNTPARITFSLLQVFPDVGVPENDPPYEHDNPLFCATVNAFLAKGDSFTIHRHLMVPAQVITIIRSVGNIESPTPVRFWVFGYVDYIDEFKIHHRAGYGRVYTPLADSHHLPIYQTVGHFDPQLFAQRNNLEFILERGYNYNRERMPNDGNDWNEN